MNKLLLLFLSMLSAALPGWLSLALPQNAVTLNPGQDVAAIVQNAPAGTSFTFMPGTYRMQSIFPKDDDHFRGDGTVILNGSRLLVMQADGGQWSAVAPRAQSTPAHCDKQHPLCWIQNDLFIDEEIQPPAESLLALQVGQSYYDDNSGKIYITTNPTGHTVEFGTTTFAFSGAATRVHISNLIVEKYANPIQTGAIGGAHAKASGWTVSGVEARWNHGTGVSLGASAHIESCNIHHNGQMGIGGHGPNVTIVNNEIAFNNYAGYDQGWEAGGSKFTGTDHLVVRSNYVHDNMGGGLWSDINNIHTLYEKNKVVNNTGVGIQYEISYDATIRYNLLRGNKSGIVVVLSPNVEVYGNVIEVPVNGVDGIRLANGSRGIGAYGPHVAHDDHVHNNIITYLGTAGRSGLSGPLDTATGMTFDANEYHILGGGENHWLWGPSPKKFSDLSLMGLERHGTVTNEPYQGLNLTR